MLWFPVTWYYTKINLISSWFNYFNSSKKIFNRGKNFHYISCKKLWKIIELLLSFSRSSQNFFFRVLLIKSSYRTLLFLSKLFISFVNSDIHFVQLVRSILDFSSLKKYSSITMFGYIFQSESITNSELNNETELLTSLLIIGCKPLIFHLLKAIILSK